MTVSRPVTKTKILSVTPLDGRIFKLTIPAPPGSWQDPGVLAKLRYWPKAPGPYPLLDRPFSVHRAYEENGLPKLDFLIRRTGPATGWLAESLPDTPIQITGPIGRGLLELCPELLAQPLYLAAGGIGLAPMGSLLTRLKEKAFLFYGERSAKNQISEQYLKSLTENYTATSEDGLGYGIKGLLTQPLEEALEKEKRAVFACGPAPLLAALAGCARKFGVKFWVSAEAFMACGLGVCLSCSIPLLDGRRMLLCQEGPAADGLRIDWSRR
ncbi:MAG: hypothetical protein LBK52_03175 [Deltaproteobacteria bacterium]|nr:hypothetical protein [Deltaproteobacteria bacterium]